MQIRKWCLIIGLPVVCVALASCGGNTTSLAPRVSSSDGPWNPQTPEMRKPRSQTPQPETARPILYTAQTGDTFDLWSMQADGAQPQQLTHDEAREVLPTWTADGSRIFFGRIVDQDTVQIVRANPDGTDSRVVLETAASGIRQLAPSPSGAQVAFILSGDKGNQLEVVDVDKAERRVLVPRTATSEVASFSWMPDEREICLAGRSVQTAGSGKAGAAGQTAEDTREDSEVGILAVNVKSGKLRQLTADRRDHAPCAEPTGERVAFRRGDDLYVVSAKGDNARKLAADCRGDRLRWSPDGKVLAYVGGDDKGLQLKAVKVTGEAAGAWKIASADQVSGFVWSPDNRSLLYIAVDAKGNEPTLYRATIGNETATKMAAQPHDLAWAG